MIKNVFDAVGAAFTQLSARAQESAAPKPAPSAPPAKPPVVPMFDGSFFEPGSALLKGLQNTVAQAGIPASGVGFDKYPGAKVTPVFVGDLGKPSAAQYDKVLDQFKVATNPRYTPRDVPQLDGSKKHTTFCNVFVTDVCLAMGATTPTPPYSLSANEYSAWLADPKQGGAKGWKAVSAADAQKMANGGKPVIAAWKNPKAGASGHVAMVRPGDVDPVKGPSVASAGEHCFDKAHVGDAFRSGPISDVKYYVYDP